MCTQCTICYNKKIHTGNLSLILTARFSQVVG